MWKKVYFSSSAEDLYYFKPLSNWVRSQCSCWVVCYTRETDYTFSCRSLSFFFLILLSVLRPLSSMYWPCSLMHTHTHRGARPPLRLRLRPFISSFPSLMSPLATLPFISFNSPMRCQSRRRWRGWVGPEDIPLSFEQPFASVSAEMEGSWKTSTHTHARERKMGGYRKLEKCFNVSAEWYRKSGTRSLLSKTLVLFWCVGVWKTLFKAFNVLNIRQQCQCSGIFTCTFLKMFLSASLFCTSVLLKIQKHFNLDIKLNYYGN